MLRKCAIKKIIMSSLALVVTLLLCIFPQNNNLDIEEEVIYVEKLTTPIYVMDEDNYVARTNIIKPNNNQVEYIIDGLTIGSVTNNYLPSGFHGTIPKGTKLIDYTIEDQIIKLNFSQELLNVTIEKEEKMIESLIFSLCEINGISKIMIFVDNKPLDKLPKSQKSIPLILDKSFGINKIYNLDNIKNTSKTTVYYIGKNDDNLYYIPITKIANESIEPVEVIVKELKTTPIYETNLISYLTASYELKDYEILEDSITLSFNNLLLANLNDKDIIEKVRYTLSLSLRDTYNIEDIVINLD